MNEDFYGNAPRERSRNLLNLRNNNPYYLTHHPEQWELVEIDGKPEFLPQFGKLVEMAGVNGVESIKGGVDSLYARAELQEKGHVVIPMQLGYLTRYPTKSGGWHYTLKWNKPKQIANRIISKLDMEAWNNFRRSLIETGVIDPIDPDLVQIMIHDIQREKGRLQSKQHIPEVKKAMNELDTRMQNMEQALKPKKRSKK